MSALECLIIRETALEICLSTMHLIVLSIKLTENFITYMLDLESLKMVNWADISMSLLTISIS